MDREAWLAERRTGLGGSDAAPVLGMSPWQSPYDVYLDKLGELPPREESQPMYWGTRLEPLIRQEFAERTGLAVRMPQGILRHPEHHWMLANLDGVTDDPRGFQRVLEIKSARSAEGWGEEGTDAIPIQYLFQVQHYMLVTAIPVADVAVLIGGNDFRIYEVEADRELQDMIFDAEQNFWYRVEKRIPPEPETLRDVQARFKNRLASGELVITPALEEHVLALQRIHEQIEKLQEAEGDAKKAIMQALGDRERLVDQFGTALVTWRNTKPRESLDIALLRKEKPELFKQYAKVGEPTRRFIVK